MLIGEFARATSLSPDTIRFYIRKGLLEPQVGRKGGRNPYQIFDEGHVRTANLIRMGQAIGMSLKEIAFAIEELREGISHERRVEMITRQLNVLQNKRTDLDSWIIYLERMRAWVLDDTQGEKPAFPKSSLLNARSYRKIEALTQPGIVKDRIDKK